MICFADSDIVIKLCAIDMFEQTLNAIGVRVEDVYVLKDELRRVCLYPDTQARYANNILNRVVYLAHTLNDITDPLDPDEQFYMSDAEIDTGEQAVFGATTDKKDFVVLTADRRALNKLAYANGCGGICKRLAGGVYCPERLLLLLMDTVPIDHIRSKIAGWESIDRAFGDAFPAGPRLSNEEIIKKLEDRIALDKTRTRNLLA